MPRNAPFAVFSVPGFASIYAVGVVWSMCRWSLGFLGPYVVNELTGSPRLVQLAGATMWAPLLLAGMVGGTVSDRFSRPKVLLAQFTLLCPLTVLVGVLALTDRLVLPVLYGYMVVVGCGWVTDMTVRRAMVYDIVGDHHLDRAMAFEGLSSSLGLAGGAMAAGALIEVAPGVAYLVVSAALLLAAVMVMAARAPAPLPPPRGAAPASGQDASAPVSFRTEVGEGLRTLAKAPVLLSILGVTAITNFFHFSYFPIVPVVAERVGAEGFRAGFLAAATGFGMAIGSMFVLARGPHRGRAYVIGSSGACLLLLGFALFDRYAAVYLSLLAASAFVGMFGATQSVLVMTAADPAMRGRALGMLSMAIGCLPIGMYALGEVAEAFGAPAALVVANGAGLAVLWLFLAWRPQVLRIA